MFPKEFEVAPRPKISRVDFFQPLTTEMGGCNRLFVTCRTKLMKAGRVIRERRVLADRRRQVVSKHKHRVGRSDLSADAIRERLERE